MQSVSKNEHDCLEVKWSDGKVDEYPYVYLRESCRCSACYTDERKARSMYSPNNVDLNIAAKSASWSTEKNQLEVNWGDGHTSYYSSESLHHLRYGCFLYAKCFSLGNPKSSISYGYIEHIQQYMQIQSLLFKNAKTWKKNRLNNSTNYNSFCPRLQLHKTAM